MGYFRIIFLLLIIVEPDCCFSQQQPRQAGIPDTAALKNVASALVLPVSAFSLQKINVDSVFDTQVENASSEIMNEIQKSVTNTIGNFKKMPLPGVPELDPSALKALKKFSFNNSDFSSEANQWEFDNNRNTYFQNTLSAGVSVFGIPLRAEGMAIYNFYKGGNNKKFTYKVNYSRDDFLDKLNVDKSGIKDDIKSKLDFKGQIKPGELAKNAYSKVPGLQDLLSETGCNVEHLMEMPMEEFKKLYNKDALKSKIADNEKLKKYYGDYRSTTAKADSFIQSKISSLDSQGNRLKENSEKYSRLIKLKEQADKLNTKIQALRKTYESKIETLVETYDAVKGMARKNEGLGSLQKFMLKVKGLSIGQHTVNTGSLVLKNYLQNGFTLEYETDGSYLLLTKGSQEDLEYPGAFYQSSMNTHNGVNEFYQFSNKYRLSGVSLGRGNKATNFQQFSLMNFVKVNRSNSPSFLSQIVNVATYGATYSLQQSRLSYDLSKSIVKQDKSNRTTGASDNGALEDIAVDIKFENTNRLTGERQKLGVMYSSLLYNNPGLNGGISRPGLQVNYAFDKKLTKKLKLSNQAAYYSLKYGNSASIRTIRNKTDLSYKIDKSRVGILVHGNHSTQIQYNPKVNYKSHSLDLLLTGQTAKRFGKFALNLNGGAGYGFNKQEMFNTAKDFSFFANTSIGYEQWAFNVNLDKFNTKNTEVFMYDSTALILVSSFNLNGSLSYTGTKGDILELGLLYKEMNRDQKQLFVTGSTEWKILKKFTLGASINIPVHAPVSQLHFINNTFNSKLIYNITGHDK